MDSQAYTVGRSTVTVLYDDITKSKAEVLVSSDDTCLSMGGGVSEAIKKAAGRAWAARVHKVASHHAPARVGDVVVTAGDPLPAKYVLHAVTLDWKDPFRYREDKISQDAIVRHCMRKVLELLPLLRCRSVALPAIGTGVAGIDPDCAASEMAGALVSMLLDSEEEYHVELCLHDRFGDSRHLQFIAQFESFLQRTLGLHTTPSPTGLVIDLPRADSGSDPSCPSVDPQHVREAFRMLRHLDFRRDQLEARLVDHLAGYRPLSEDAVADLRRELVRNEEMRHAYEVALTRPPVDSKPTAIFLSSTFEDLKTHRQSAIQKVLELGFQFMGMEDFPAWPQRPAEFIQLMVQ